MTTLRAGVIGTGFAGRLHALAARRAGAELVGVAASSQHRADAAAEALRAGRGFASGEALATSDEVDVIHVCAPNRLHQPLAIAALRAGKHVVLEKPVAMDLAGGRAVAEAAEASGAVVTVPFVYRFYPTVREARMRLHGGEVGALRVVHGTYLQDWLSRSEAWNWRVDPAASGPSRTFADIGSHWCDLVEFVSGHRIVELVADLHTVVPHRTDAHGTTREVETEDLGTMLFRTNRDAAGSVVVSQVSPGRKNRFWVEFDAAEGSLRFDQERPDRLWVGGFERTVLVERDADLLHPSAGRLATTPGGHPQGYQTCFDLFVADTYAAIRGEEPDGLPRLQDGLRAQELIDAVLESSRRRAWVQV